MPSATAEHADLKAIFSSAGYDTSDFTPEERKCIAAKIETLRSEGKPEAQSVAVAISMCAPSKAKGKTETTAGAGTFEAQLPSTPKIEIKGGAYRWERLRDGYFLLHDLELFSEVKKGTRSAPEDVTKEHLELYVRNAQAKYQEGNFCATAFVGHHQQVEITHPSFAGYVLPNRVGLCKVEGEDGKSEDRWTVFGDVKVNAATFEKIWKGELPYRSVEIPWVKNRISGLALLPTRPPFWEYRMTTLGEEIKPSGQPGTFAAVLNMAKFMADDEKGEDGKEKMSAPSRDLGQEVDELRGILSRFSDRLSKYEQRMMDQDQKAKTETAKMSAETKAAGGTQTDPPKPTALPLEPGSQTKGGEGTGKMEALDPKMAAQFEAQSVRIKALEDERAKEKSEAERKRRIDWAMGELKGYIIAESTPGMIAKFAAHDEVALKEFVAELKKVMQKEPPTSIADFKGVDAGDPAVARFVQQGPVQGEKAAKFAAEYRAMKQKGWNLSRTEEQYIEFRMKDTA